MKIISLIFFTILTFSLCAQTDKKLQTVYESGMWVRTDSCTLTLNRQYGFVSIESGSCMPPIGRQARHNKKVEKLLTLRNGEDWRTKYDLELKTCDDLLTKQLAK